MAEASTLSRAAVITCYYLKVHLTGTLSYGFHTTCLDISHKQNTRETLRHARINKNDNLLKFREKGTITHPSSSITVKKTIICFMAYLVKGLCSYEFFHFCTQLCSFFLCPLPVFSYPHIAYSWIQNVIMYTKAICVWLCSCCVAFPLQRVLGVHVAETLCCVLLWKLPSAKESCLPTVLSPPQGGLLPKMGGLGGVSCNAEGSKASKPPRGPDLKGSAETFVVAASAQRSTAPSPIQLSSFSHLLTVNSLVKVFSYKHVLPFMEKDDSEHGVVSHKGLFLGLNT